MNVKRLKYLLLIATALTFARVVSFDFVALDDEKHLLYSRESISAHWERPYLKLYIPLTYTAWSLIGEVSSHPAVFHAANLALHLFNVWLVWNLFALTGASAAAVFMAAAIFALHPMQAEPVAWVSGLRDVLSAALFLSALLLLRRAPPTSIRIAIVTTLYFFALTAKPNAVVFPAVAYLLTPRGERREIIPWIVAWIFLALPFFWITEKNQYFGFPVPTVFDRTIVATDAIGFYLHKFVWPLSLAPDYGRAPYRVVAHPFSIYLLLGVATLVSALFAAARRILWPMLALVFLLPTLGFIAFVFQTTSTLADRYVYLAMIGIGFGVLRLGKKVPFALAVGLALFLSIGSFRQTGFWKDTPTLLRHTVSVNPESWVAWHNLGVWHERRGELAEAERCYLEEKRFRPAFVTRAAETR